MASSIPKSDIAKSLKERNFYTPRVSYYEFHFKKIFDHTVFHVVSYELLSNELTQIFWESKMLTIIIITTTRFLVRNGYIKLK